MIDLIPDILLYVYYSYHPSSAPASSFYMHIYSYVISTICLMCACTHCVYMYIYINVQSEYEIIWG